MAGEDSSTPILAPDDPINSLPTGFVPGAIVSGSDGFQTATPTVHFADQPTASSAPPTTATPTTTLTVGTVTASPTAAAASSSASSDSGHSGIPLGTILPAVLVPVLILLIAIPLVIFCWLHRRNKKLENEQRRMSTPDMRGPSTNASLLHKQSQPSLTFTPFSDGEKTNNGSPDVYETQKSMENAHGGEAIALNARNRSWSNGSSPHRGPSPTLPSPNITKRPQRPERPKDRPTTQEAWPLPAHSTLPDPDVASMPSNNKPLPAAFPAQNSPHLPPMNFHEPLSMHDSLATDSSIYDLSATAGTFPSPPLSSARPVQGSPGMAISHGQHNKRESDLVSELSNTEEQPRTRTRRDTDAISVVSAMTSRSRSQRRKSAQSAVSALSPDEPELPIQPFSLR